MLATREEAKRYLRRKYPKRIWFSQTMDRELPELETGEGAYKTYIFIVKHDGRMAQCHIDARGNTQMYYDYSDNHQNLADDWE